MLALAPRAASINQTVRRKDFSLQTTGPYLSVAETCRRLGVSRKALRLYEAQGLVRPERTQAEWRVFGPEQIQRLHQVLALKHFGFPLNRVADILNGEAPNVSRVLALHEKVVACELERLQRAAHLLRAARAKWEAQGDLSSNDLIALTKETLMTKRSYTLDDIYKDIAANHLTEAERATLTRDGVPVLLQPDPVWPCLHAEAERLMAIGDPNSIEAIELARRWMEKVFEVTGGNPALTRKVRTVARHLHDNPTYQAASTSSNPMMDFVQKAYASAIAAGVMPKPIP
ncbi:MAG: MerR family transcriptional regulator [Asticcacaulis sp.]|uniref:MerR family transcriptional regulator n=1 Tax=Asticcacaulis sp. TaxID=1872648 RepID=UPI0039E4F74C